MNLTNKQQALLDGLDQLMTINNTQVNSAFIKNDIEFLMKKISNFRVVVPIVGKYSSGKSTLLNAYLCNEILKTNISPETAIATELTYGETETVTAYYVDDRAPNQWPLSHLSSLEITSDMLYLSVTINNKKLQAKPELVIVDMPGFDADNANHQKAIARYLSQGDYFINLMPVDIPFDHSVINQLSEIYRTYGKDITCLLSKTARKSPEDVEKNTQQMKQTLRDELGHEVLVGHIEVIDHDQFSMTAFEDALADASSQFDELLEARYQQAIAKVISQLEAEITQSSNLLVNSADEIEVMITQANQNFQKQQQQLNRNIDELRYNLCSTAREKLEQRVSQALRGSQGQLVNAAKNQSMSGTITTIIRPILQSELDNIIREELARFEDRLSSDEQVELSEIIIDLIIPEEDKDNILQDIVALLSVFAIKMFGPTIGAFIDKILSIFGSSKDDAKDADQKINTQIEMEVIPAATKHIMQDVANYLQKLVDSLSTRLAQQFEQKKAEYTAKLQDLHAQKQAQQQDFEQQRQSLQEAQTHLTHLRQQLNLQAI